MPKYAKIRTIHFTVIVFLVSFLFLIGSIFEPSFAVHADTVIQGGSTSSSTFQVLSKYSFGIDREAAVIMKPQFEDGSTNIIFYKDKGNGDFENFAGTNDNLYVNTASFADYPGVLDDATIGDYVAIEFSNDAEQFTCASLSLSDCASDPHFISQTPFEITDDSIPDSSVFPAADTATTTISNLSQLLDALASSSLATTSLTVASSTDASSTDATSSLPDSEAIRLINSALASSTATSTSPASSTNAILPVSGSSSLQAAALTALISSSSISTTSSVTSSTSSAVTSSTTVSNLPQLLDSLYPSSTTATSSIDTTSTTDTASTTFPDSEAIILINSALSSTTTTSTTP